MSEMNEQIEFNFNIEFDSIRAFSAWVEKTEERKLNPCQRMHHSKM